MAIEAIVNISYEDSSELITKCTRPKDICLSVVLSYHIGQEIMRGSPLDLLLWEKIYYDYYSFGMVVNFICQLTGLRSAQTVGETLSQGVCV